jgi:hypothetical protein
MERTAESYFQQRLTLLEGRLNALRPHILRAHRTREGMQLANENERLRAARVAAASAMASSLEAHERKLLIAQRVLRAELNNDD